MSQELRDKILEDNLVNRKLVINGAINEAVVDLITLQIFKFNEEDDESEFEQLKFTEQYRTFDRASDPIKIYINSPGGEVLPSLSVISAIESSKTPVETYAL